MMQRFPSGSMMPKTFSKLLDVGMAYPGKNETILEM